MAIRSFRVAGIRGLRLAEGHDLPNLVGIAGPNGAGKSTLLDELRINRSGIDALPTQVMYSGPHRGWRDSTISEVNVLGLPFWYGDVLRGDSMPGVNYPAQGLQSVSGQARKASTLDEAQSLVKTSIVRLRNRHQDLLEHAFQLQKGQVLKDSIPDVFSPLARLVTTLLPHLHWEGIDTSDKNNIRCLFCLTDRQDTGAFDIDMLSSGEKAAIALFLPFIEQEVKLLTGEASTETPGIVPHTLLIDEPEIHLHPLLQLNVLEYMRDLAREDRCQFIVTTQSPAILDALYDEELYLLTPAEIAPDNQFSRLTDSAERLELARTLTGATHLMTRAKPIVFIEGEPDLGTTVSDERLLRLLLPDVRHWALIPSKGKSETVSAAKNMRTASLHLPGLPVFALVDSDTGETDFPDYVVCWPVAMLENLLLDSEVLWETVQPYRNIVGLESFEDVRRSLIDAAKLMRDDEIAIRLRRRLPRLHISLDKQTRGEIETQIGDQVDKLRREVDLADVDTVLRQTIEEVESIVSSGQELERFHGKRLLDKWYLTHDLNRAGFGKNAFKTEIARRAAGTDRLKQLAGSSIQKIRLYFPPGLVELIREAPAIDDQAELLRLSALARDKWESGIPEGTGRGALRERLVQLGRTLQGHGDGELGRSIIRLAVSIGTE
ncbi:MAG: AAA family ATPase [Actinobacteria bacterium]|nr:AAA family ATPase [Actinomycetota bacterium]